MVNVAINGFGRIGKQFFLASLEKKSNFNILINELSDLDSIVYTLKYDSVHPTLKNAKHDGKNLIVNNKKIKVINEPDVTKLPWASEKIDLVVDCTGMFTNGLDAKKHLIAGAKRVLISAPAKGHDQTIVFDINNSALKKEHKIISAGSCTTNCITPMLKVLNDSFKVESAHFVTTHAMTATQKIIDGYGKKDYRGGRSAPASIVPSTSGASISVVEALPELKGSLEGYALRVPVIDGSITTLFAKVKETTTVEKINSQFKKFSLSSLKNILDYTVDPIVSKDIIHNPASCIFDSQLTKVVKDTICVSGWYDNEWGYSNRLVDVTNLILKLK